MKKALKFTFGTMLAASMATPALAHFDTFIDNSAIWIVGTYTEPSNNGLSVGDFNFSAPIAANIFEGGRRAIFIDPDHTWDYGLGFRFHVPHSHAHVYATYDHFHESDTQDDLNLRNIGTNPDLLAGNASLQRARVTHNYHDFKRGYSHGLHFPHTRRFCMDVTAFVEYDTLTRTVHEFMTGTIAGAVDTSAFRRTENDVRGVGPGVGATGRVFPFSCYPAWSFFAGVQHTIFYAREEYNQRYQTLVGGGGVGDDGLYEWDPERSHSLLGKLDINFGLEYCHALGGFGRHSPLFDIALGLRFMNIYNAFKNGNTAYNIQVSQNPGAGGGAAAAVNSFARYTGGAEDWGRWGPYIQFSLLGSNA